jgi:two-component system NarL family response regulator
MSKGKQTGGDRAPARSTTAIVIDDQLVFRLGLRIYLTEAMPELDWAGEADSVEAGLALAERARPDLILVDAVLGETPISEVLAALKGKQPSAKLVVLANYSDPKNLALAANAGAHGYMMKTLDPSRLVEALREVLEGRVWIQPELARHLYAAFASEAPAAAGALDLTPRQTEVLLLVAQGLKNSEIANRLVISEETVKTHVAHLLEKLGVSSRLQAANYAIRNKLVDA